MSRSGYYDDGSDGAWSLIRWRGAVASAIRGKRGQAFLHEMIAALDALPQPRLIVGELEQAGEVCAIGSVGRQRGLNMADIDIEDREQLAEAFGIATAMAAEIMYENDEACFRPETPEQRFQRMRAWAVACLAPGLPREPEDRDE